ncbi:MAG: regulator of sigma E protease [Puniceicoccaceae bacterium 5H]|nr:MAG: regulator of sigma E protease [Puniceicoccaceae bacterium 5H]
MLYFLQQLVTNPLLLLGIVVAFGACIFIHELGHYLAARWRGLIAERFSIGFGPKLFGWTDKHGCTWQVSPIPLGGYVLLPQLADMKGIEGESERSRQDELPPISYTDKMVVSVAGAFFNLIFAFVLATVLWGIGQQQDGRYTSTQVGYIGQVQVQSADGETRGQAWESPLQLGDTILAVDGSKVKDYEDLVGVVATSSGRDAEGRPEVKLTIERNGEVQDIVVHPDTESRGIRILPIMPAYEMYVDKTSEHSPAAQAGLQSGDQLLSVAGQPLYSIPQLSTYLDAHEDELSTFTILRDGKELTVQMEPEEVVINKAGDATPMIGVHFAVGSVLVHENPVEQVGSAATFIFRILGALLNPRSDVGLSDMSSVVGISQALLTAFEQGIRFVLNFLVVINVNLAILNLLPIPVLDGGHMAFATIAKLRGKPIPANVIGALQGSFMVLLLGLMLYVSFFDVRRVNEQAEYQQEALSLQQQSVAPVFDGLDADEAKAAQEPGS